MEGAGFRWCDVRQLADSGLLQLIRDCSEPLVSPVSGMSLHGATSEDGEFTMEALA